MKRINKLNSEQFMYDRIKYYEEEGVEEVLTILNDYEDNSLKQLIEFSHNVLTRDDIDKDEKKLRRQIISELIAKKLSLVDLDRFQYALDEIIGEIHSLRKEHKELEENFKKHRHNMDKHYSEKPAW